ncbi:hypothetical protein CASFOL_031377 [Castilleja foliolosa]|uniref:Uncharacterized protein n=1 Tax=Castilleja foliolosa TaxID=1961234 RepID=A0ABD3C5I5_9LAMI
MVPKSQWLLMLIITFSFFMSSCNYLRVNAEEIWKPILKPRSAKVVEYGKVAVENLHIAGHKELVFKEVRQGGTRQEGNRLYIWIDVICTSKGMKRKRNSHMYTAKMYEIAETDYIRVTEIKPVDSDDTTRFIGPNMNGIDEPSGSRAHTVIPSWMNKPSQGEANRSEDALRGNRTSLRS